MCRFRISFRQPVNAGQRECFPVGLVRWRIAQVPSSAPPGLYPLTTGIPRTWLYASPERVLLRQPEFESLPTWPSRFTSSRTQDLAVLEASMYRTAILHAGAILKQQKTANLPALPLCSTTPFIAPVLSETRLNEIDENSREHVRNVRLDAS